jgi:hypothetical protein
MADISFHLANITVLQLRKVFLQYKWASLKIYTIGKRLVMIQTWFVKKYFQICKQAVRKFPLNFKLTYGVKLIDF